MLHRSNISSALKYLAPSSHPRKACKFTGKDIPVFPNIKYSWKDVFIYSPFISCHLVNGALITKLKMHREMEECMHLSGLLRESHLFNKYAT